MADLASRMIEEAHGHIRRLSGKLERHRGTLGAVTTQVVSGFEAILGGVSAAGADYFLGTQTSSGIPELSVGPVPVVATVAAVGKLAAVGLAMGEKHEGPGLERVSHHVNSFADALLAGESALTSMRMLLDAKLRTIPTT